LGNGGSVYQGIIHIADWLPTFLAIGGMEKSRIEGLELDGMDLSQSIRSGASHFSEAPRQSVIYELTVDGESVLVSRGTQAIRKGPWKLVQGSIQDPHRYMEPTADRLNSTDHSQITRMGEILLRLAEGVLFGPAPFDIVRTAITHSVVQHFYPQHTEPQLFNLESDPYELQDLASENPAIIQDLQADIQLAIQRRPEQQVYWMILDLETDVYSILYDGDCSMNSLPSKDCKFQHALFNHTSDIKDLKLCNGKDTVIRHLAIKAGSRIVGVLFLCYGLVWLLGYLLSRLRVRSTEGSSGAHVKQS